MFKKTDGRRDGRSTHKVEEVRCGVNDSEALFGDSFNIIRRNPDTEQFGIRSEIDTYCKAQLTEQESWGTMSRCERGPSLNCIISPNR